MRIQRHFLTLIAVLTISIQPFVHSVMAQGSESTAEPLTANEILISLRPQGQEDGSRFGATIAPGESAELTAVMQNFGEESIELRLRANDLVPVTNGGLRMANRTAEPTGSTTWMELPEEEFTLESGEIIERSFTVVVPPNTPPGEYVNAIALETVNPVSASGSLEQFFSKIVAAYIVVPGDGEFVSDFTIGSPLLAINDSGGGVMFSVENIGQVRIDLLGTVTLTDSMGNVVFEGSIDCGPIYMGQQTVLQIPFDGVPVSGEFGLSYSFTDRTSEVNRSMNDLTMEMPDEADLIASPVRVENVEIVGNADPIAFANVSMDLVNDRSALSSARLTLSIYHNGELVEEFVLLENVRVEPGTTTITQRYIPAESWEEGTYSFSLKLESTEDGNTNLLFDEQDVTTLEVP